LNSHGFSTRGKGLKGPTNEDVLIGGPLRGPDLLLVRRFHGLKPMAILGVPLQGTRDYVPDFDCRNLTIGGNRGEHRVDKGHEPGCRRPKIWVMLRAPAWERLPSGLQPGQPPLPP
jgi:hypothetical protein